MYIYSVMAFCTKIRRHPWVILGLLLGDLLVRDGCDPNKWEE